MSDFVVKDSGVRQEYSSGMVRDTQEGKTNFLLAIDGPMFERYATHMTKGAAKYGARNWQLASSEEELERFKASALRHLMQWLRGDRDEDHAAAVWFNVNAAEHVKAKLNDIESVDLGGYEPRFPLPSMDWLFQLKPPSWVRSAAAESIAQQAEDALYFDGVNDEPTDDELFGAELEGTPFEVNLEAITHQADGRPRKPLPLFPTRADFAEYQRMNAYEADEFYRYLAALEVGSLDVWHTCRVDEPDCIQFNFERVG